jgi:hypothetical protein
MNCQEQKEGGWGLVGIRKQKGTFEIHLANTLRQQQQQRLRTNVSFLIVDSKVSLVEEELNMLSLATYSNSESAVLPYISIFETIWAQTELKIKMG